VILETLDNEKFFSHWITFAEKSEKKGQYQRSKKVAQWKSFFSTLRLFLNGGTLDFGRLFFVLDDKLRATDQPKTIPCSSSFLSLSRITFGFASRARFPLAFSREARSEKLVSHSLASREARSEKRYLRSLAKRKANHQR
jgi:hypothetical protein